MTTLTQSPVTTVAPTRRPRRTRKRLRRIPLYAGVTVLLVVMVYPLLWLLLGSFKTQDEFLNNPTWSLPESFTNFSNYAEAWSSIALYLRNSVLAVFPALALVVVLGTAAGYALEVMVFRGRGGVLLLFLAGIMIPGQMILLPLFTVYFKLHLTSTLWPLIITYTATGLPLTVFMMATYFRSIPR